MKRGAAIVARIGEKGFQGLYSVKSILLFVWLVFAFLTDIIADPRFASLLFALLTVAFWWLIAALMATLPAYRMVGMTKEAWASPSGSSSSTRSSAGRWSGR